MRISKIIAFVFLAGCVVGYFFLSQKMGGAGVIYRMFLNPPLLVAALQLDFKVRPVRTILFLIFFAFGLWKALGALFPTWIYSRALLTLIGAIWMAQTFMVYFSPNPIPLPR